MGELVAVEQEPVAVGRDERRLHVVGGLLAVREQVEVGIGRVGRRRAAEAGRAQVLLLGPVVELATRPGRSSCGGRRSRGTPRPGETRTSRPSPRRRPRWSGAHRARSCPGPGPGPTSTISCRPLGSLVDITSRAPSPRRSTFVTATAPYSVPPSVTDCRLPFHWKVGNWSIVHVADEEGERRVQRRRRRCPASRTAVAGPAGRPRSRRRRDRSGRGAPSCPRASAKLIRNGSRSIVAEAPGTATSIERLPISTVGRRRRGARPRAGPSRRPPTGAIVTLERSGSPAREYSGGSAAAPASLYSPHRCLIGFRRSTNPPPS